MRVKSKKDRLNGVMAAVAEAIDVPREVLVNEPEVCLKGQSVLTVTNHAGVGAYSESALWVRTAVGPLSVWGKGLFIERFSREMREELEAGNVNCVEGDAAHYGFNKGELEEVTRIAYDPKFYSVKFACENTGKLGTMMRYAKSGGPAYVARVIKDKGSGR